MTTPRRNNRIKCNCKVKTARKNNGTITPGEVAIEADVAIEKAKSRLEELVTKGFAEIRVRKSGVMVYYFPEFGNESENTGFEDL